MGARISGLALSRDGEPREPQPHQKRGGGLGDNAGRLGGHRATRHRAWAGTSAQAEHLSVKEPRCHDHFVAGPVRIDSEGDDVEDVQASGEGGGKGRLVVVSNRVRRFVDYRHAEKIAEEAREWLVGDRDAAHRAALGIDIETHEVALEGEALGIEVELEADAFPGAGIHRCRARSHLAQPENGGVGHRGCENGRKKSGEAQGQCHQRPNAVPGHGR